MNPEAESATPKVFISYRWSSPEHEEWVLLFASSLRQNGIEAILDKWHLSEGQDTLAFMESMVNDLDVKKVLLVCDRGYVERANSREGGVGTEAQIISAKVYESVDQNKFAAIVMELDADGRPLLPHYMATRLYFDMSSTNAEAVNFQKVVRWIFGKPFHAAPPVGEAPAYLDETFKPITSTAFSGERLRHFRATGSAETTKVAKDVLADASRGARDLILDLVGKPDPDEIVFESIRAGFPLLEDTYRAFAELIRGDAPNAVDTIHSFFEAVLRDWEYVPMNRHYSRWDNDALHYFGHEALVGFVAVAMQERAFSVAADVLALPLFKPRAFEHTGESASYADFRPYLESLEARNRRLELRRLSLHADLIAEHHEHSIVSLTSFLEADLTLYARGLLSPKYHWYPISGIHLGRSFGALPTYVRAASGRFYDRLKPLLLNLNADTFRANITASLAESKGLRFDYREVSVPDLLNLGNLATAP